MIIHHHVHVDDAFLRRVERMIEDQFMALHERMDEMAQQVQDFAAKQREFNTRLGQALDGISGDVKEMNDKITQIQNSPGTLSPEDQQALDELQTAGEELVSKFEALDALRQRSDAGGGGGGTQEPGTVGNI